MLYFPPVVVVAATQVCPCARLCFGMFHAVRRHSACLFGTGSFVNRASFGEQALLRAMNSIYAPER